MTLDYVRHQLGDVMGKTLVYARETGDIGPLEQSLELVKHLYESEMKEAANLGKMDRGFLEQHRRAIERMEGSIIAIKIKRARST